MAADRHDLRHDDGQRSLGTLFRDLAEGGADLVRDEVRLARLEFSRLLRGVARGTALVAAGGVLALLGALASLAGLILLAGDQWLRDRHWVAALIAALIAGGAAAFLARRGLELLSPRTLVPDQTLATLQEDKEWLKRRLT
jgi:hypothetical protein